MAHTMQAQTVWLRSDDVVEDQILPASAFSETVDIVLSGALQIANGQSNVVIDQGTITTLKTVFIESTNAQTFTLRLNGTLVIANVRTFSIVGADLTSLDVSTGAAATDFRYWLGGD